MRERIGGTWVEHVRASCVAICRADNGSGIVLHDGGFWCEEWVIVTLEFYYVERIGNTVVS
jgi:hypothetical protein